ncbi:tRNA lysidine(34) synthetase TilS [Legionella sp.]|uniref:tRNA lysidine(34) synthetase TilS n=1 Tax=Legionella sp. TaxID=459 RepID=UPI003C7F92F5
MNHCIDQLLNSNWLSYLTRFRKLIVGFSGGLDSTVLLHALAANPELVTKLVAVHINHGMSPHAFSWQQHCNQWCQNIGIEFISEVVQFDRSANVEEHARLARYAVFSSILAPEDCLILGHHQDDQAETVLLQLFRGAGIDGLAAMPPLRCFGLGMLARPFLVHTHSQLKQYAMLHRLTWIEDESNLNTHYSRNYLRQQIMPLLMEKWPGLVGNLARTALHCQEAKNNLSTLATYDITSSLIENSNKHTELTTNSLSIEPLLNLNLERISNILRVWLRNNRVSLPTTTTFHRLIHELIFATTDAIPEVSWSDILVRRYQKYLYLDRKHLIHLPACSEWSMFPSPLTIETNGSERRGWKQSSSTHNYGLQTLEKAKINLFATEATHGLVIPPGAKIVVRFRKGGETFFWHGQNKQLKKLLQEWGIPPWLRKRIPLLYIEDQLVVIVGYAVSDLFFNKNSLQAWSLSAHFNW